VCIYIDVCVCIYIYIHVCTAPQDYKEQPWNHWAHEHTRRATANYSFAKRYGRSDLRPSLLILQYHTERVTCHVYVLHAAPLVCSSTTERDSHISSNLSSIRLFYTSLLYVLCIRLFYKSLLYVSSIRLFYTSLLYVWCIRLFYTSLLYVFVYLSCRRLFSYIYVAFDKCVDIKSCLSAASLQFARERVTASFLFSLHVCRSVLSLV